MQFLIFPSTSNSKCSKSLHGHSPRQVSGQILSASDTEGLQIFFLLLGGMEFNQAQGFFFLFNTLKWITFHGLSKQGLEYARREETSGDEPNSIPKNWSYKLLEDFLYSPLGSPSYCLTNLASNKFWKAKKKITKELVNGHGQKKILLAIRS